MTLAAHALPQLSGRVEFHAPPRLIEAVAGYDAAVERMLAPRELRVIEIEDAIFVNRARNRGLYDRDGRRVEESRLMRHGEPEPEFWPCEPQLDSTRVDETIDEPVVFRSLFFKHWGHFLLESMARLWPEAAGLESIFPLAWGETEIAGRYAEALGLLGVRWRGFERGRRVRLAKVWVPTPSYAFGAFAHPRHLEAPQRLARKLLGGAARDPRPVYLSRTDAALGGHDRRRLVNEPELESALAARGVRIAHMQQMSLAEQIALVNAHRVFIGPFGSALHNLMFSLNGPDCTTYVLIGAWLPRDFVLVDSLVGNRAHYLMTLSRAEGFDETRGVTIDVEATLGVLREGGAI